MIDPSEVASRVADIRNDIARLSSHSVSIIAVTKTFSTHAWTAARDAGCDGIGENYAQELLDKIRELPAPLPIHFIGAIQSNKVKALAPYVSLWQGVDRPSIVSEIAKRAPGASVLLQVNTTHEESKSGISPNGVDELRELAESAGLTVADERTTGILDGGLRLRASRFLAGCGLLHGGHQIATLIASAGTSKVSPGAA